MLERNEYGYRLGKISMKEDTIAFERIERWEERKWKKEFDEHSIFAKAEWDDPVFTADKKGMTPEAVGAMVKGQIRYNIHNPKISKVRKMLTIEQFQNEKLKRIQSKQSYEDVLRYNTGLIRFLIREGILKEEDPETMGISLKQSELCRNTYLKNLDAPLCGAAITKATKNRKDVRRSAASLTTIRKD